MSLSFVRRITIATLALPLLLGGCTDDDPVPKMPDSSSPSSPTTETSTAAPVEPTLPPEAEGKGPKAAEAFVRHYYDTVNYAQTTGDTKHLRSLGAVMCDACNGGADAIDRIKGEGGTIEGGDYTVSQATVTGRRTVPDSGALFYLTVRVTSTEQKVSGTKDLDGTYGGGATRLRFEIANSDVGFQITSWSEQ